MVLLLLGTFFLNMVSQQFVDYISICVLQCWLIKQTCYVVL